MTTKFKIAEPAEEPAPVEEVIFVPEGTAVGILNMFAKKGRRYEVTKDPQKIKVAYDACKDQPEKQDGNFYPAIKVMDKDGDYSYVSYVTKVKMEKEEKKD